MVETPENSPTVPDPDPLGPPHPQALGFLHRVFGEDERLAGLTQSQAENLTGRITNIYLAEYRGRGRWLESAEWRAQAINGAVRGKPLEEIAQGKPLSPQGLELHIGIIATRVIKAYERPSYPSVGHILDTFLQDTDRQSAAEQVGPQKPAPQPQFDHKTDAGEGNSTPLAEQEIAAAPGQRPATASPPESQPPETALVQNLLAVREFAKHAPNIPLEEQNGLLDTIRSAASALLGPEGQDIQVQANDARRRLAASYMKLVISEADKMAKRWGYQFIEDLTQSGIDEMLVCIGRYAASDDRLSFSNYLRISVQGRMRQEISQHFLRGSLSGRLKHDLSKYKKAIRDFRTEHKRDASFEELATILNTERGKVAELARISLPTESLDLARETTGDLVESHITPPTPAPGTETANTENAITKAILIERGLSLLPRAWAQALTLRFGLAGSAVLTDDEIAKKLGMTNPASAIQRAKKELEEILPMLEKDNIDWRAWRSKNGTRLNTLVYTGIVGLPVFPHHTLEQLRTQAREHLETSALDNRRKKVMRMLFGLGPDDLTFTHREVASELGLSEIRIRQLERDAWIALVDEDIFASKNTSGS